MPLPIAGSGYQLNSGNENSPMFYVQPVPISFLASATVSPDQLAGNSFFLANPAAAANLTLPTVQALELAYQALGEKPGTSFEIQIININATNAVTIVANTGWTITNGGNMVVNLSTSARFLARKTGPGAWQLYRLL